MAPTLHPSCRRSSTPPIVATSNDGILPLDLLHDILLRLPTEPICRFRAVCRSWRSILSHPEFIAAAGNPGPLLAAAVSDYNSSYLSHQFYWSTILDTESGDELKRISFPAANVLSLDAMSHERVVGVVRRDKRILLLDPATGARSVLPDHAPPPDASTWCTIGRAAMTGEHKVLAITTGTAPSMSSQVCKILTFSGCDHDWRETGSPPLKVATLCRGSAIVNGVAYIWGYIESAPAAAHQNQMIMELDLDCEAWRPASLRGPLNRLGLSLAELQGHLVAGYDDDHRAAAIELWFLVDSERSIWSKRYTITMSRHHDSVNYYNVFFQKPLALLDDGRIVMWMQVDDSGCTYAFFRIYDPRTNTFWDGTTVADCTRVIFFAWSLLQTGQRGTLDRIARLAVIRRSKTASLIWSHHYGTGPQHEIRKGSSDPCIRFDKPLGVEMR